MLHEKNENIRRTIIVDNQSIQEEKETLLNFGRKHHSIQKNTSSSSIVVLPVEYSFFYYWYHLKIYYLSSYQVVCQLQPNNNSKKSLSRA